MLNSNRLTFFKSDQWSRRPAVVSNRAYGVIFGDIDTDSCTDEFVYGHGGKPHFIAGPYDKQERCDQIMSILTNRCGLGNFYYTLPLSEMPSFVETPGTEYLE